MCSSLTEQPVYSKCLAVSPSQDQEPPMSFCVMVNCKYQLDWAPSCLDIWLTIISVCVCEVVLDEVTIWISRLSKADHTPPTEVGLTQSIEDLKKHE